MGAIQESIANDIALVSRQALIARRPLNEAEKKIREGTAGRCEVCGRPIPPARLAAIPEATQCVPCAERKSSIAVVPSSRTLVVDVPLGKDVFRVGAEVTDETKITVNGRAVPLDHLKAIRPRAWIGPGPKTWRLPPDSRWSGRRPMAGRRPRAQIS